MNAIVLRPLPFGDPDRIVAVTRFLPRSGTRPPNLSAADFYDFLNQNRSFRALAYYAGGESSITVNGTADYANVQRVTPDCFESLGVQARIGRLMSAEEHEYTDTIASVVSHAFWQRRLDADPKAIGATINLGSRSATVIGVLPPGVRFPSGTDVYMPSWIFPETPTRGGHNYRVV